MSKDNLKQLDEAKKLINKGVDGDPKAVNGAYELLLQLRRSDPGNALVEAYYGSSLTLLARDAVQLLEKAEKAQEGLDALDHAVSMDPNHLEIRMLRAHICLLLPESFFHCSQKSIEDFTFLLDRYTENPKCLTEKQVGDILKNLGMAYRNAGKADEAKVIEKRLARLTGKKK